MMLCAWTLISGNTLMARADAAIKQLVDKYGLLRKALARVASIGRTCACRPLNSWSRLSDLQGALELKAHILKQFLTWSTWRISKRRKLPTTQRLYPARKTYTAMIRRANETVAPGENKPQRPLIGSHAS